MLEAPNIFPLRHFVENKLILNTNYYVSIFIHFDAQRITIHNTNRQYLNLQNTLKFNSRCNFETTLNIAIIHNETLE